MSQEHHQTNDSSLDKPSEPKPNQDQESQTQEKHEGTGFWSTVQSVLGAMFGVQSEQQREKDFDKGNAIHFIVGGVIFVVVFILTILYFVNSALENAGG